MTEPTTPAPVPVPEDSPAGELITAGAAPTTVDVNDLLAKMQAMQAQIDAMRAASGVPSDPVGAAVKDLKDHVKARADMHPHTDFDELQNALKELSENPATRDAEYIRVLVDEFAEFHRVEGVEYLQQLARDLYKIAYKAERGEQ